MQDRLRLNPAGIIGLGLGFMISGLVTSTLGFCGQDFSNCLSVHPSATPLTQFVGSLMVGFGLVLFSLGLYGWIQRRPKKPVLLEQQDENIRDRSGSKSEDASTRLDRSIWIGN